MFDLPSKRSLMSCTAKAWLSNNRRRKAGRCAEGSPPRNDFKASMKGVLSGVPGSADSCI